MSANLSSYDKTVLVFRGGSQYHSNLIENTLFKIFQLCLIKWWIVYMYLHSLVHYMGNPLIEMCSCSIKYYKENMTNLTFQRVLLCSGLKNLRISFIVLHISFFRTSWKLFFFFIFTVLKKNIKILLVYILIHMSSK